jgi:hypothetical protein
MARLQENGGEWSVMYASGVVAKARVECYLVRLENLVGAQLMDHLALSA